MLPCRYMWPRQVSASAQAFPIPLPAPVTNATLPVNVMPTFSIMRARSPQLMGTYPPLQIAINAVAIVTRATSRCYADDVAERFLTTWITTIAVELGTPTKSVADCNEVGRPLRSISSAVARLWASYRTFSSSRDQQRLGRTSRLLPLRLVESDP